MKKVIVLNRFQAQQLTEVDSSLTRAIISISNWADDHPQFNTNNHSIAAIKYVEFLDMDTDELGKYEPECFISKETARDIAEFVKEWWDRVDQIVVHCDGGVSRSAGCAAAILKYFTGDDFEIFDNPNYYPNMLVYRRVLNALMEEE